MRSRSHTWITLTQKILQDWAHLPLRKHQYASTKIQERVHKRNLTEKIRNGPVCRVVLRNKVLVRGKHATSMQVDLILSSAKTRREREYLERSSWPTEHWDTHLATGHLADRCEQAWERVWEEADRIFDEGNDGNHSFDESILMTTIMSMSDRRRQSNLPSGKCLTTSSSRIEEKHCKSHGTIALVCNASCPTCGSFKSSG